MTSRSNARACTPAGPAASHSTHEPAPPAGRRGRAGTATLEWLLIIVAAGGFAAAMTTGLDRLVADHTDHTPHTGIDARPRIAAAHLNDLALAATAASPDPADGEDESGDTPAETLERLRRECERLPDAYPATVTDARWQQLPAPPDTLGDPSSGRQHDQSDPDDGTSRGRWVCRLSGPDR